MRTQLLIGGLVGFLIVSPGGWVMAETGADRDPTAVKTLKKATFAGGCFWCMEAPFEQLEGVVSVRAGYSGGTKADPTYEEVSLGTTGHAEALEITYDPSKVSYASLLDVFWRNVDPTTPNQQFADVGSQYRTVIFYHDEEQRRLALKSKADMERSGKVHRPIVTEIVLVGVFYQAEDYHQNYHKKNPLRYKLYRKGSGREDYINKVWGQ